MLSGLFYGADGLQITRNFPPRVEQAHAATTGALYAVGANNSLGSGTTWSNTSNATGNTTSTSASVGGGGTWTSKYLMLDNFNFASTSLVPNSTINGITARVEWQGSATGVVSYAVLLTKDGINWAGVNQTTSNSQTTKAIQTYGGPSNLWGTSWTADEILSPTFGIHLAYTKTGGGNHTADVFRVSLEIDYTLPAAQTTLATGTDPGSTTVAPGSEMIDGGAFTLRTNYGVDSVTALTVSLAASGTPFNGVSEVRITNNARSTTYFSAASNPSSNTVNFSGGTPIPVTNSAVQFRILITPKTHANMPAVPGEAYNLEPRVSAFTSTNGQAGSDTNSDTLTIDNLSPGNVTSPSVAADGTTVELNWINPADSDFTIGGSVVVLRRASSAVTDSPVEGSSYSIGNTIGSSTVACVVTGSPPSTSCVDSGLSYGTAYHYKIFTIDANGNYNAGTVPTGSPATPAAPTFSQEGYRLFENPSGTNSNGGPTVIADSENLQYPFKDGRAVFRSANGNIYAVARNNADNQVGVFKSTDGSSWTQQGSYVSISYFPTAAAMDGKGYIHIFYSLNSDLMSILYNTNNDSFGNAELVYNGTSSTYYNMAVAVDANNIPHVVYGRYAGSTLVFYYTNKIGGSWKSPVTLATNSGSALGTYSVDIAISEDNIPELVLQYNDGTAVNAYVGNANNASSFSSFNLSGGANDGYTSSVDIAIDADGNTWVLFIATGGSANELDPIALKKHNDADGWSTWSTISSSITASSPVDFAIVGNDVHVFYSSAVGLGNVVYNVYSGGSWVGPTTLHTGTYNNLKQKSATFHNNYGSAALDHIFWTNTPTADVFWGRVGLTDPYAVGTALAAQDTVGTLATAGASFRLRTLVGVASGSISAGAQGFKLQYGLQAGGVCTSGVTWADVTNATSIAYQSTGGIDGSHLTPGDGMTHANSISNQNYVRLSSGATFTNRVQIPASYNAKFDFALRDNGADGGSTYCLRLVLSDGSALNTYSTYAQITMAASISGITVSGTVYTDEGVTTIGSARTVRVKVNGAGDFSASTNGSGVYSVANVIINTSGDVVTVFLDGAAEKATIITRTTDTSSDITGLNLYQNFVIVRHENAGPITNTNLDQYDSDQDIDIQFTVTAGALTVATGNTLLLNTASTFSPGGNVTANGGFKQTAGTFNGGTGTITSSALILVSGTFTSTSGNLFLSNDATSTVLSYQGGTFNHNNGTLIVRQSANGSRTLTLDLTTSITLYNLIYERASGSTGGTTVLLSGAGNTVVVNNNFTMYRTNTGGSVVADGGAIHIKGNTVFGDSSAGGNTNLIYNGTGDQTYSSVSGGIGPRITIDKASGTLTAAGGSTTWGVETFTLTQGSFTAPTGIMTVASSAGTLTLFTFTAGTFNHNNGTLTLGSSFSGAARTYTISLATALTVNNLNYEKTGSSGGAWTVALSGAAPSITALGNLNISASGSTGGAGLIADGGTIIVSGDLIVAAEAQGGTTAITLNGTGVQTITHSGGTVPAGTFTINKASGTATLASSLTLGTSQAFNITSGTFSQGASFNLIAGDITVGASGVWSNLGTGSITLGGNVSNAGTITLNSDNGSQCVDGTDSIVITSSVGATQRTWSGAGTFNLYNLNVTDMLGALTAYTSAFSNSNWFNGGCGLTISGTVYSDEGVTTLGPNRTVRIKVNGAGEYTASNLGNGTYSASGIVITATGDVVTVFLDGDTEKAVSVTRAADTLSNIAGLDLYQNTVIVRHEDAGPITNASLGQYDSSNDADIQFTVTGGALTVATGNKLIVWTGKTFAPGGAITTPKVLVDGTLNRGLDNLTLTGVGTSTNAPFVAGGTYTYLGGRLYYMGDGDTDVAPTSEAVELAPNITANRNYYLIGANYGSLYVNPTAASAFNLKVNLTQDVQLGAQFQGLGSSTVTLDTTVNGFSVTSTALYILTGATFKANSSSVVISGSGTAFQLTGTFTADQSTVSYANITSAQNIAAATYYNLILTKISNTNTLIGNVVVNNDLTVSGGTFNLSTFNLTVTGITIVTSSGILDDTSTTGTNIFVGKITIVSGSSMFPARNSNATIRGGIENNGTFSVGTGTWTFNTNSQSIIGTNTLTFGGIISVASGVTLTNSGTITMTGTGTGRLAGAGTFVNGTGATLNYAGSTITTTTFIAGFVYDNNTVNYNSTSTAQTVRAVDYENLVITKSSQTATLSGSTGVYGLVNVVSGTLELSTFDFFTLSGIQLTISGTFNDNSATGANTIIGPTTINSGGSWTSTGDSAFTIRDSIVNNGTFTGGSGTYTFNTNSSSLSGSNAFTFGGIITINSGIVLTNTGTVNMTGTGSGLIAGAGAFVNDTSATLNYTGSTITVSTLTATATGNTVNYNSTTTAQTVLGTTYYNLTINKTGQTATLGANSTVTNNLIVTAGTLTSNASGTLTIHGNLTNNGTFAHNSGTVVIAGSGTSIINGSSNTTFNNFTSTVPNKTIQFKAGNIYTFASTFTITGTLGNLINITSDTGAAQWLAHFSNPQSNVTYANISWSGCNSGTSNVSLDATSVDGGNNEACWVFDVGVVVSGIVYSDDGTTLLEGTQTVRVKVNGAGEYSTILSSGSYSIPNIIINGGGDVVTVYLDGSSQKAVAVTITADLVSLLSNINLYQNELLIYHQSAGTVTNANLNQYDSDNDVDIQYTITGSDLSMTAGNSLRVMAGASYLPGGNVSVISGGLHNNGTITMNSGTLTVDGDGSFGGNGSWSLYDLNFGDGTGVTVTTSVGSGVVNVSNVLTIAANQTLLAAGLTFELIGLGVPFAVAGTFDSQTSTIIYSNTTSTNVNDVSIAALDYYNLTLGSVTEEIPFYTIGTAPSQAMSVSNLLNVLVGTMDLNTNDVDLNVNNLTNNGTILASASDDLIINGTFTNNGTFTHNNGTTTITPLNIAVITGSAPTTFYNLTSSAAGKVISFKHSQTVYVEGQFYIHGTAKEPVYLTSTQLGSQWLLGLSGTSDINNAGVGDGGCAPGTQTIPRKLRLYNLGNNGNCWVFFAFNAVTGPTDGGSGGVGAIGGGGFSGGGSGTGGDSGGSGAVGAHGSFIQASAWGSGDGMANLTLNNVLSGNTIIVAMYQTSSAVRAYTISNYQQAVYINNSTASGIFYATNVSAGTHNITLNANTSGAQVYAVAMEISGISASGSLLDFGSVSESVATNSHVSASSPVNVSTNGFVITVGILNSTTGSITSGEGYTGISNNPEPRSLVQYKVFASAGTDLGEFTNASTARTNTGTMASFSAQVSAGGGSGEASP